MSSPEQDESPTTELSGVPALINDYRAQRDAWRAMGQDLERIREEALAAADREARNIVATAQNDVRRILLKAHHDLLGLSAQVRAATEDDDLARGGPSASGTAPATDTPPGIGNVLVSAQQDVHNLLSETRAELEALANEGAALRTDSSPQPVFVPGLAAETTDPEPESTIGGVSMFQSETPSTTAPSRRTRHFGTAGVVGVVLLGAAGWIIWQPRSHEQPAQPAAAPAVETQPLSAAPVELSPVATTPAAATPAGGLSVNMEATQSVWVQVSADGQIVATRIFEPGETHFVTNARDVSIRAGNGAAVLVSVNGGPAAALGREGVVATRRFTPDELAGTAVAPTTAGIEPLTLR